MTELDFRSIAQDALECMIASYGDTAADEVAQSIRVRCAMAVNAHSVGLLCGHEQCFPVALGAVFHATIILAEQAGFDLLTDLQDSVNAIRVLQETRRLIDSCSPSPDDVAPPAAVVGEPGTRTVPPDGAGAGDLPSPVPSRAVPEGERTGTVPPDGTGDDLTPPHGIPRRGISSLGIPYGAPLPGEPEFNVFQFPTPAIMPSPFGSGRASTDAFRVPGVCPVPAQNLKETIPND